LPHASAPSGVEAFCLVVKSVFGMNARDFRQATLDSALRHDLRVLLRMAISEDLDRSIDATTVSLVPQGRQGEASIIARSPGIACGLDLLETMVDELEADFQVVFGMGDRSAFHRGDTLATLRGQTRDLLTCERTILNFLGRLCGIATWTQRFCQKVEGTKARLYDTRKTTPGWRRLEKYATQCGGARNHRMGLYDAILIKDNHLACRADATGRLLDPEQAVQQARDFLASGTYAVPRDCMIEIEVDSVELLQSALRARPDIVLLDNMSVQELRQCVQIRDSVAPPVQLEASGGVNLDTIGAIAQTGVERISVGALTHSAVNLDLGLDWLLGK
jgi:nicotinate-nucleotide pyrophosphorylase (carboxylating)